MRDGPLRRTVKFVTRMVATAELWLRRRGEHRRGGPRFRLEGTCNGCGKCCETPALQVGRLTWNVRALRWWTLWWQRVVEGWVLVEEDPRLRVFVFKCTHYDPVTKQCDSYDSRPLPCRDYPRVQLYHDDPSLFADCSYRVLDKQAAGLKAALVQAGVSGEKLKELSKKLHLGDE